jgi:hypothetical protein
MAAEKEHQFKAGDMVLVPAKLLEFTPKVKEGHARFQVIDEHAVGEAPEIICSTRAVRPMRASKS